MKVKLVRSLVSILTFVGVLILTNVLTANSAHALPIEVSFDALIVSGPSAGATGSLAVEYDDNDIDGVGLDVIAYGIDGEFFNLTLEILGETFDETDDALFGLGGYPSLVFNDGLITFVDFMIDDPVSGIDSLVGSFVSDNTYVLEAIGQEVSEPGTFALLGIGFAGLGFAGRRMLA
mgnify:CR=1 FL=1